MSRSDTAGLFCSAVAENYLQGIDPEEIVAAVHTRRPPMMLASAGLKL